MSVLWRDGINKLAKINLCTGRVGRRNKVKPIWSSFTIIM